MSCRVSLWMLPAAFMLFLLNAVTRITPPGDIVIRELQRTLIVGIFMVIIVLVALLCSPRVAHDYVDTSYAETISNRSIVMGRLATPTERRQWLQWSTI
jgi:hypothetical protein